MRELNLSVSRKVDTESSLSSGSYYQAIGMPEAYRQVFELLDGYREGKIDFSTVQSIDQKQLQAARAWMDDWMNARMDEAFPEHAESDELSDAE